jgi:hypothetical protein
MKQQSLKLNRYDYVTYLKMHGIANAQGDEIEWHDRNMKKKSI